MKLALATMRCVRFAQGEAGFPLRRGGGTVDGGEVLKLKVVNYNNYFRLCKFFGPPIQLECSTTELSAELSVMTCEISCMHIEVGYLCCAVSRYADSANNPVKERHIALIHKRHRINIIYQCIG